MWTNLWAAVEPAVISVAVTILTALAAWVGVYAKAHLSEKTIGVLNQIMQTALENAAGQVINEMGSDVITKVLSPGDPVISRAVQYVLGAVPDTIEKIGLTPSAIAQKIVNKIGSMIAPALGADVNPVVAGGAVPSKT